jgi:nucleotide-binding universal stress UspA family protein
MSDLPNAAARIVRSACEVSARLAAQGGDSMNDAPYIVLVGMDFSELADRAFVEALDLATRRENVEVHVVSMLHPVATGDAVNGFYSPVDDIDPLERALERLQAHVQVRLELFVEQLAASGRKVSGRVVSHVRSDDLGMGIAQLASELNASLIVVGTHGRRGLARMLMGSIAETTMRYARCPVLVIPHSEKPVEIEIEPACPECLRARVETGNGQLWCAQHRERHGRRHTYHQVDRGGAETNFPLTLK